MQVQCIYFFMLENKCSSCYNPQGFCELVFVFYSVLLLISYILWKAGKRDSESESQVQGLQKYKVSCQDFCTHFWFNICI